MHPNSGSQPVIGEAVTALFQDGHAQQRAHQPLLVSRAITYIHFLSSQTFGAGSSWDAFHVIITVTKDQSLVSTHRIVQFHYIFWRKNHCVLIHGLALAGPLHSWPFICSYCLTVLRRELYAASR